MILNDKQIKKLAEHEGMITPFVVINQSKMVLVTVKTFGYDLRVGQI